MVQLQLGMWKRHLPREPLLQVGHLGVVHRVQHERLLRGVHGRLLRGFEFRSRLHRRGIPRAPSAAAAAVAAAAAPSAAAAAVAAAAAPSAAVAAVAPTAAAPPASSVS